MKGSVESDDDDIGVFTPGGKMYQLGAEFEDDYDYEKERMKKLGRVKGMPSEMRYFDTAKIYVGRSGNGGNGVIAFRREKFVPNGGPSGGNGGIGGDVAFTADENMHSLQIFRKKVHHRAKGGKHGVRGRNVAVQAVITWRLMCPAGTIVRDSQTREILCELLRHGESKTIIAGGRGGRGNASFKTSKNKVPMLANYEEGQEMWIELELKLVADVGVIGAPNAGKSSLLAAVSAARPKIADYPFTTIVRI